MKRAIGLFLLLPLLALGQIRSTLYDSTGNVLRVSTEDHVVHTHEAVRGFKLEFLDFSMSQWTVDNTSDKINYYGDWTIGDDSEGSCGCSFSKIQGDSLTYYFTGVDRIEFWGEQATHHGIAEIYIDNVLDTMLDTYSPNDLSPALNWFKSGLDPDLTHSFKMVITGTRNPSSTGAYVVLQHLKLFAPVVEVPPPAVDPNNPITLSNGITVLASSYENDPNNPSHVRPPAQIMDGDMVLRWSAQGDGEWIQFELPEYQTMESIDLSFAFGDTRIYTFDLKFGNDGVNWDATIMDNKSSGNSLNFEKFDFPDRDAKFLRVIGHGSDANVWNNYNEIQINIKVTIPPPIDPPDTIPPPIDPPPIDPPPADALIDIVRQGYYLVFLDGVQVGGGHSEYDKAVEKAVNAALADPSANVLIQSPTWRVEYK